MEALSTDQVTNPFEASAVTWLRVCSEQPDFHAACHYFARGTRASLISQPMAVHVDGVAQRKQRHRTSVELLTTRWADVAHSWPDSEREAELAATRRTQPLVAKSVWLRTSVSLDVRPCRGLALVAGTESEHGVPTPLPDRLGRDVERGGFTRAVAQSCQPDDCLDDIAFDAARRRARGRAGPQPMAGRPRQVPGGRQGQAGQPQRQVQRASPRAHNPRPANGWAAARQNRTTGTMY